MTAEAWFSLGTVGLVFVLLTFTRLATDLVLVGAVTLLMLTGILSPSQAFAGMSNQGMITVAVLFIVGAGVRETGAVEWVAQRLFGHTHNATSAIIRVMVPNTLISAFMNNTPLVAMMIPAVSDWAKKHRIAASKVMIPLSYATILGGTCSLIGTSTNIVVNGMFIEATGGSLKMFDIAWVGIPAAIIGVSFVILTHRWLLPDRRPAHDDIDDPRKYTIEMLVPDDSPLVGKSIEQAGLRHLQGVFLAEIDREGIVLAAVSPEERLRGNDRLVFVGVVDSVVDLQRIRGLQPATDQVFKLDTPRSTRCLVEAVVSNTCPLVNGTIRDGRFRSRYNAVVVAVSRNGERLKQKIGDIVLQTGDTLLVEAHPSFADLQKNNRDFFLVSRLDNSNPPRHERAGVSLAILLAMIVASSTGLIDILPAAMIAAGLMMVTRCVTVAAARRSVDWEVLIAIAASFALGVALEDTGAAKVIADWFVSLAGGSPWLSLAVVYFVTLVVTEMITNNAAAALMFPFAMATAANLDVSYMPFVIAVMMGASAGFATPIGYQTNLMVYGPGGYRFSDYLRIGVPLDILVGIVTVVLAPLVWPFY